MYEFIRIQFILGKLSKEQVVKYSPKWISIEEVEEITKEVGKVVNT